MLTAPHRICAMVGGALSETVASVSLRTEKMLSIFRLLVADTLAVANVLSRMI